MNTDALKCWGKALTPGFPLDVKTFLITSLIPGNYLITEKGITYMVADVAEIRKISKSSTDEGLSVLFKAGYIKWLGTAKESIVLGEVHNYTILIYYFMQGAAEEAPRAGSPVMKMADDPEMQPIIEDLERRFAQYVKFCETIKSSSNPEYVLSKINAAIKSAYKDKFTPSGLAAYFNGLNAMAFEWVTIPSHPNGKDLGIAKTIIERVDSRKLMTLVPFFIDDYPTFARKGYEETSLANFQYNTNTILTRYGKAKKSTSYGGPDTL